MFADVVLQSPAGKMLSHILSALLVLPLSLVMPVLHQILTLLPQLDTLAKLLPGASDLEEAELEFKKGVCLNFRQCYRIHCSLIADSMLQSSHKYHYTKLNSVSNQHNILHA